VQCAFVIVAISPFASVRRIVGISLVAVLVVGGAIEIIQTWIPNRAPDLLDLSGDLAGAIAFLGVFLAAHIGPFASHPS